MLELRDLAKRYGDVVALDGCSFTVNPGRMLGFLGPNGAGKTTTMRCVFNLVVPDRGDVRWRGGEVSQPDLLRFGYMPESRGLYPRMKIIDQLEYFGTLHGMSASAAESSGRRWLGLLGLSDRVDDRLEELSHGNQQRVQLAAALVHDPELVILDEPFSGLDPIGVETMAEVLTEQARSGTSVVFSSHQLDLVEDLCEDVAIIHEGKIVVQGKVSDLKDSAPVRHVSVQLRNGAAAGWVEGLPGVRSWNQSDGAVEVIVAADSNVSELLKQMSAVGDIVGFSYGPPRLSDLFREAVA